MNHRFTSLRRRRGVALIYVTVALTVLIGAVSLAVDWGRVQLVKTEMQRVADASARYGAAGLRNILGTQSAAANNAIAAAADNIVDGESFVLDPSDVELGVWDTINRTFTPASASAANAVRVTARRTAARNNPVQTTFARLLGFKTVDVTASAIAMLGDSGVPMEQTLTIPATSNPFLAGAAAGTIASNPNPHNNPDYSDGTTSYNLNGNNVAVPQSKWCTPEQATGVPITGNKVYTFDGINGGATNDYTDPARYSADGNQSWVTGNTNGSENGIADITCPGNSLIGVFLTDAAPNSTAAPESLDMSTPDKRNFSQLRPQLKQLFFIGDGRRDSGEVQTFVAPTGATRLFIGTWDSYEWNNNIGSFQVTLHDASTAITLVN